MKSYTTGIVGGALVLGVLTGTALNHLLDVDQASMVASQLDLITDVFLRLVKMLVAPLIFSTLVSGIAHIEDTTSVGRIGAKAMIWFIGASLVSLLVGLVMVQIIQPGAGLYPLAVNNNGNVPVASLSSFSLQGFITHLVPTSFIDAMAKNETLQIVLFSAFVGAAISSLDNKARSVLDLVEQMSTIILKIVEFVMRLAPLSVFASLASAIAIQGPSLLITYGKLVLGFYGAMGVFWLLLFIVATAILGKSVLKFIAVIKAPALLAFSTASSEAAYGCLFETLPSIGIRRRIVNFVLPLGYSFNLDGSMIYCSFGAMFIMQVHGVQLSLQQQIFMLALLMVTSKGIAGVPRASVVVIMATLAYFNLPEAWIGILLGVDHLLDMGRSATNVIGNSLATVVVDKWEGWREIKTTSQSRNVLELNIERNDELTRL